MWLYKDDQYAALEKNIPTKFRIGELPDLTNTEVVVRSNGDAHHQTDKCAVIILDEPILIRSGVKYDIRMEQFPPNNCCTGALLYSEIQVEPDFTFRFHNDPVMHNVRLVRGSIMGFTFIKI